MTRGGGQSEQFSSQPHPTKQSSEFSRPEPSGTSAQPEPSKPAEPSPESDPSNGPVQHGDLRHPSHHPASRPTLHGSRSADPNYPQSDMTRGGGAEAHNPERRSSSCATPNSPSQPSRHEFSPTSTSQAARPATSPEPENTASTSQAQHLDQPNPAAPLHHSGDQHPVRPLRHRPPNPNNPQTAKPPARAAIVVTTPSNRVRPAVLATPILPDLHLIDPAGRVLTKKT